MNVPPSKKEGLALEANKRLRLLGQSVQAVFYPSPSIGHARPWKLFVILTEGLDGGHDNNISQT